MDVSWSGCFEDTSTVYPLFMKYRWYKHTVLCIPVYPTLFPVLLLQSLYVPFRLLVSTLFYLWHIYYVIVSLKLNFLTYRRIQTAGLCTQYTNLPYCVPLLAKVLTAVQSLPSECAYMQSCLGSGRCRTLRATKCVR